MRALCIEKGLEYHGYVSSTESTSGVVEVVFLCEKHAELGEQHAQIGNFRRPEQGCKYCAGKQLPKWYVLQRIQNNAPDIEILDDWRCLSDSVSYHCRKHDYYGRTVVKYISLGKVCPFCGREKLSQFAELSVADVRNQVALIQPHIHILEYEPRTRICQCYCKRHHRIFQRNLMNLRNSLFGCGCILCYRDYRNQQKQQNAPQMIERLRQVHPMVRLVGEYRGYNEQHVFYCQEHHHQFQITFANILNRVNCCGQSTVYRLEKLTREALDDLQEVYEVQKTFPACRDKRPLPFDFYLPQRNMVIECNGEQHYKPVVWDGNEQHALQKFKYVLKHDAIKRKFCTDHGLSLLIIPFDSVSDVASTRSLITSTFK